MANTTFDGLPMAVAINDSDVIPLDQPSAYDPLTQSMGVTRKITVKQLLEKIDDSSAFGYDIEFDFEPTLAELALWRALPEDGRVILISEYERLAAKMYVGDSRNATADWWYKCDATGAIRNTNGPYMRVADKRGLFTRAAGQNSKYKMANDAPYDGGAIGALLGDAIRNITGFVSLSWGITGGAVGVVRSSASGAFVPSTNKATNLTAAGVAIENVHTGLNFDASQSVSTAPENRSVSIAAYLCIRY
jgi:hypothetical protein